MKKMFGWAKEFNQPLNNWNVSNVTDMGAIFYEAEKFNQNISNWNVTKASLSWYSFSYGSWLTKEKIPAKFR